LSCEDAVEYVDDFTVRHSRDVRFDRETRPRNAGVGIVDKKAGIEPAIAMGRQPHHPPLAERFEPAPAAPDNPTPVEAMAHRLKTPRGRALYALRKQTPEPVFGIIKSVLGFRQFSLRGLSARRVEPRDHGLEHEANVRPRPRLLKAGHPGAENIQLHRRSNRHNRNAHKARPGADRRRNAGRPVRRPAARTQSDRLLGRDIFSGRPLARGEGRD
jgi:Transposase DDE domain